MGELPQAAGHQSLGQFIFHLLSAKVLNHPEQVQSDQDDGNNEQGVNPIPGARKPWADIRAKEAKQPQYKQDYDDSPQHEISPFIFYLSVAT